MERMIGLLEHAFDLGVDYVTVYALSTENLQRPAEELEGLYQLIRKHFREYMKKICERGVRLRVLGDTSLLPEDVRKIIADSEAESAEYRGRGINVALAYGSRAEIVRAANLAVMRGETVTEESFAKLLYTGGQPDPDLVIRTGKERRISNFLLYQAAYAEFYFSDKMFPRIFRRGFGRGDRGIRAAHAAVRQNRRTVPRRGEKQKSMKIRLITGSCYIAVLLVFFLLKIFVSDLCFDALIYAFALIGTFEMTRAMKERITRAEKIVVFAFAGGVYSRLRALGGVFGLRRPGGGDLFLCGGGGASFPAGRPA